MNWRSFYQYILSLSINFNHIHIFITYISDKIEEQFDGEVKPAVGLSDIPTVLKPDARNAYSCKVHCLLQQNCDFAVLSAGQKKCYIGPTDEGNTKSFLAGDQAFLKKGIHNVLRRSHVTIKKYSFWRWFTIQDLYKPCTDVNAENHVPVINLGDFGGIVKISSPGFPGNYPSNSDCH